MRARRLVTWPFTAFLFGYGSSTNDPTVVSIADTVLSSAVAGCGLAIILGLPLALIFRRGDGELTRGVWIAMAVTLVATVVLDFSGLGLIGAAMYFFWMRGARPKGQQAAPVQPLPS